MKQLLILFLLALGSNALADTCTIGKPCGNTCISVYDICHLDGKPASPRYKITFEWVNPDLKRFDICQEALKAGVTDFARSDERYRSDLDLDRDGVACEKNGDDNASPAVVDAVAWKNEALLPQAPVKGVLYVDAQQLASLGGISFIGEELVQLTVGSKTLTFTAGKKRIREGAILEAVPFSAGSFDQLMIPLSSLKLVGCSVTRKGKTFNVKCPDGSTATGGFKAW